MGSRSSKVAKAASGVASRQYPTRPSGETTAKMVQQSPSQVTSAPEQPTGYKQPKVQASATKSDAINLDAHDPQFAASLRSLGPVQPNPTYSPSSTSSPMRRAENAQSPSAPSPSNNAALNVLAARQRIQTMAEQDKIEMGRPGWPGKRMLDISSVRKVLVLRDEHHMPPEQIEKTLGLKKGLVAELGRAGVVEAA